MAVVFIANIHLENSSTAVRKRENCNHYYLVKMENSKAIEHFKATDSHLEGKNGLDFQAVLWEEAQRGSREKKCWSSSSCYPMRHMTSSTKLPWTRQQINSLLESIRSRWRVINYSVIKGTGLAFVNRNLYDQLGRILAHSTLGKDKLLAFHFSHGAGTT